MSLFLRQQSPRSELQAKIAAELQEKLQNPPPTDTPSLVADAEADAGHKTRLAGILIVVLFVALVGVIVWWASQSSLL